MKINNIYRSQEQGVRLINQPLVVMAFITIVFLIISTRLFSLQVLRGHFFRKLSDENRIRLIAIPPIRGRLLDRQGKIIADNRLSYSLSIQPRLIASEDWISLRDTLAKLLNLSEESLESEYQKGINKGLLRIILARNLNTPNVLRFKEQESNLKGAQINEELIRHYPYGTLGSHALGYTQLITEKEYNLLNDKGYKINDRIGRTGLEAAYESQLRGSWGGEMLEVDSTGIVQQSLGIKEPSAGKDLTLTIDLRLQMAAEKALESKPAGAIIALDPRTGAIRAMASRPNFNLDFFAKTFASQKEYDQIFMSPSLPLLSRAINAYDPGSTWKVVTGMAGMESGKFPSGVELQTTKRIQYGSHCFPEHNARGFGKIGYEDAYRVSSNTFFYQVGVGTGSKELYEAATKLGFDQLTGVEISAEESKGLVGSKEWADQGRGWGKPGQTPWIPEDIASASIGQSVIQVTPLQLARAYAVFANGGYLVTPHFVEGETNWKESPYRTKVDMKVTTLETIRRGLRRVVESGTGMRVNYNLPNLPPVAGKTGTAEDSTGGLDHSWFACFAPYQNSEIVVVAFAQNSPGGGSVHALPMARQILEVWNLIKTSN